MAGGLNKCMIIGNVGRDPEVRYTPSGAQVASLSVAVNRSWTDQQGQKQEEVEWFSVVAWNKLAEIIQQYVNKGDKVYFDGRIRTRSWDGDDGVKRYRTELIADQMVMLGGRRDGNGGAATDRYPEADARAARSAGGKQPAPQRESYGDEPDPDDMPF